MRRLVMGAMIAAAMIGAGMQAQEVSKRQDAQQDRIAKGVASGQLTSRETARLETRETNLSRAIRRDRRTGGHLSARERRQIKRRQNRLSRDIARQKHDTQKQ
jgi:hypothetical protein